MLSKTKLYNRLKRKGLRPLLMGYEPSSLISLSFLMKVKFHILYSIKIILYSDTSFKFDLRIPYIN